MTAIGRDFTATLSTNERGPVERRKAGTRLQAKEERAGDQAEWLQELADDDKRSGTPTSSP
jgi:hypothetical protein